MKLSKAQSHAIFSLIRDELNSKKAVSSREIELGNKKREQESIEKFKNTPEFKAIMLLGKTFKARGIGLVEWSHKAGIEMLAHTMFKPERKSAFFSSQRERNTIELLAIDCKNLAELKEKVNAHYNLKKKLK